MTWAARLAYAVAALWLQGGVGESAAGSFVRPRPLESAWPSSLLPYVSLLVALAALWKVYRDSQHANVAPIEKKVDDVKAWAATELGRMQTHFDHKLEEMRTGQERRVEALERGSEAMEAVIVRLVEGLAESRQDRAGMGRRVEDAVRGIEQVRDLLMRGVRSGGDRGERP